MVTADGAGDRATYGETGLAHARRRTFDANQHGVGHQNCAGEPETLSAALAQTLVQLNIGTFGSLCEIVERSPRRIVLQKTGPMICNQPAGMLFSEAEKTFESLGHDTTRVSYLFADAERGQRAHRAARGGAEADHGGVQAPP